MFTQLDPPIPLHVLGKGDGYALGVIDYGQEHNRRNLVRAKSGGADAGQLVDGPPALDGGQGVE